MLTLKHHPGTTLWEPLEEMIHKVSSSSKIYLIQLVNFLDFLEDSCIFHFEDVCLESLLYLIVFVALSSHSASSFPLEIISSPPHPAFFVYCQTMFV